MRRLIIFFASLVAAAGLVAGPASAVSAVPVQPVLAAAPVGTVTVEGETWSAPDQPVSCTTTSAYERVTCEPKESESVVEEKCFSKVALASGAVSTVCTTYDGNRAAIDNASEGGELKLEYGCQLGDALCLATEIMSRAASTVITSGLSWAIGNASFNTASYLWDAAVGEWAWWQAAVIGVVLIAAVIALSMAAWSRDKEELAKSLVRIFFSLPLSAASVWTIGQLANVADELTQAIITRDEGTSLYATIENMIFNPAKGNFLLAGSVLAFFVMATIVLICVFSFRNFALASLIALGPVAWMLFPAKFGGQWVVRWISAVAALLLVSPLTLGVMMLVLRGFGEVDTLWSIQAIPLGIGLCMLVFAPLAVFGLFSFAVGALQGNAAENAASNLGSRATQKVGQGARAAASGVRSVSQRASQARQTIRQANTGTPASQNRTSQVRAGNRPTGGSGAGPNRQPSAPPAGASKSGAAPSTRPGPAPTRTPPAR